MSRQFAREAEKDIRTLRKIISLFPEIESQAKSVKLAKSYRLIEMKMAECFCQMRPQVRMSVQEKMPLIILCRLIAVIEKRSGSNQDATHNDRRMDNVDKPPAEKASEKPDL